MNKIEKDRIDYEYEKKFELFTRIFTYLDDDFNKGGRYSFTSQILRIFEKAFEDIASSIGGLRWERKDTTNSWTQWSRTMN